MSSLTAFARRLGFTVLLCVAIAAFMTLTSNEPFGKQLLYSLCIGLSCQALIGTGMAAAVRAQRARYPGWPRGALAVPVVIAGALGGLWLGMTIGDALTGLALRDRVIGTPRMLTFTLGVCLAASAVATAWFYLRAVAQAAERSAAEAQLKLLESQLEPHMLFNTLANLRALIGVDPPRAQEMLDRLIAYLRATLSATRAPLHPLSAEFERLDDYLALMATRMGSRLAVQLDLPAELRELPVPPLLLQPLVENAIKHGLEPKREGGRIEVQARADGGTLVLSVRDTGLGLRDGAADGMRFGNVQVRERLKALHGNAARFTLEPAPGGGALARITLPLR